MYKFVVVLAVCLAAANAGVLPGLSPVALGSPWALGGPTIVKSAPLLAPAPTVIKSWAPSPIITGVPTIVNSAPLLGSPVIKTGLSPIGLGPAIIKSPLGLSAW